MRRSVPLVLASGSPRRRELLAWLGLCFEVRAADIEERRLPGEDPASMARRLSLAKARAVAPLTPQAIVIAADTLVVVDGDVLGKPADPDEAFAMLARLRGRAHDVLTGLALADPSRHRQVVQAVTTRVTMRDYTDAEIIRYVETGDPMDKAGAYAIQAPEMNPVARIEGSYTNVVGLPLCVLCRRLRAWDVPLHVRARGMLSGRDEAANSTIAAGPGEA